MFHYSKKEVREAVAVSHRRGACRFLTCLLIPAAFLTSLCAEGQKPNRYNEYQIEAAYLLNFGKFIDWPAKGEKDKSGSFVICVLGDDPFGLDLDNLLSKGTVKGKGLTVKRSAKLAEVANCQMLFISSSETTHLDKIIAAL